MTTTREAERPKTQKKKGEHSADHQEIIHFNSSIQLYIIFWFKQIERDTDRQWCIGHQGRVLKPPHQKMLQFQNWSHLLSQILSGWDPISHSKEVEPLPN